MTNILHKSTRQSVKCDKKTQKTFQNFSVAQIPTILATEIQVCSISAPQLLQTPRVLSPLEARAQKFRQNAPTLVNHL